MLTYVLPFETIAESDRPRVGGKGYTLARLTQAGFPVPPGFCLTQEALHRHLTANELQGATPESLRRAVVEAPLPDDVHDALWRAWKQLTGGKEMPLAVRSSSPMEDGQRASFAGQYDTLLNVQGMDSLVRAVKMCWASLWADRALAYHARQADAPSAQAMGVVVQVMVQAGWAGVAFTLDPTDGKGHCLVIEAVPGLGEALVSGQVRPYRCRVDRRTLRAAPDAPDDGRGGRSPPDDVIRRVADLALRVEAAQGTPQDVEWAWEGDRLYLLQARPITTLDSPSAGRAVRWTRENVGEVVPEVVTPLTWSVMEPMGNQGVRAFLRRMGLPAPPEVALFGRFYGRVYLNETRLHQVFHAFYPSEIGREATGLGRWLRRLRAVPRLMALALRAGWTLVALPIELNRFVRRLYRELEVEAQEDTPTDPALLLGRVDRWQQVCHEGMEIHLAVTVMAGLTYAWLEKLVTAWRPTPTLSVASLMTGLDGMESAEVGLALRDLACWAAAAPKVRDILLAHPPEPTAPLWGEVAGALQKTATGQMFWARLKTFLEQHGHNSLHEFELAFPRWCESPGYVLAALQNHLRADQVVGSDEVLRSQRAVRREAEREMRGALRWGLRRLLFELSLRLAQSYSTYRENAKYYFVKAYSQLRQAYLALADALVAKGMLDEPADLFFLTHSQVCALTEGGMSLAEVRTCVGERRAAQSYYQSVEPPSAIEQSPDGRHRAVLADLPSPSVTLKGLGASPGRVTGRARVVLDPSRSARLEPGEILIAPATNPAWSPLFLTAGALVTEIGGLLSHAAIVAREYGVPAVLNVPGVTARIRNGQLVTVDGELGIVQVLEG